ncbi:stage II sporulation protein AA (anti-sigma F factor antagonist) [Streptomyces sp. V3I8]|uniref:STAS domain-containing protein n=1 Tax=Streptomyces sp. V3I8 TaxID=3042279 RepID=UPI0027844B23|nr:STAS domain-containing protein [Streptomyces sp. V3I8]MDQ1035280.1 stage II sporulation protein AA (anti-sigma F factor antagonist) [Streptomyces sp. V3I8]
MTDTNGMAPSSRLSVDDVTLDGIRVLVLRGEIDHTTKDHLAQTLLPRDGAAPSRTVLDFSAVTFMDSSGVNILVAAYQAAHRAQGWIRIAGAQEAILRVLHIVALDDLINCHPTLEQALHS